MATGRHLHLAGVTDNAEDAGTLAYLEDTARQAGLDTTLIDIEGDRPGARTAASSISTTARSSWRSSSIPGNGCFTTRSARGSPKRATRWIEPPWKAILSNKGILPLLWEMFPGHPNLLPAFFEDDPNAATARRFFCAQAALFPRRRQCGADQRRRTLVEQQGLTAPKDSFARPWRRCRIFPANIPCSEAG